MQVLLGFQLRLEFHKVLSLDLFCFFRYINNIFEDINSSIRLFADVTSLYIIVDDPIQAADQLNSDLAKSIIGQIND